MPTITKDSALTGPDILEARDLYLTAFRRIDGIAAQNHITPADEFAVIMADPKIDKWRGYDDTGRLAGLGVQTTALDRVPLIAPVFFAANWPALYHAGKIWYVLFVCVTPGNPGLFADLIRRMSDETRAAQGITAMDFCQANEKVAEAAKQILTAVDDATAHEVIDVQAYHLFDFQDCGR